MDDMSMGDRLRSRRLRDVGAVTTDDILDLIAVHEGTADTNDADIDFMPAIGLSPAWDTMLRLSQK